MTPTPEAAALALFESGRLPEAEAAWRAILARKPDDPEALHMLGYILAQLGRGDEGLPLIDRSIERAPGIAGLHSNRAVVLNSMGRDEDAMRDLLRALQLDPRTIAARNLLGNILRDRGRAKEAADNYRHALGVDPRSPEAHVGLGVVHLDAGEREAASREFAAALAADPGHAAAHFNVGILRQRDDDLAGAEASFRRALAREPANAMALNNLSLVLRRGGREAEARECIERALAAAPRHPDVLNNAGISRQRAGRAEEALELFDRAVAARPGFARALVNSGNTLQDLGRLDDASRRYGEALRSSPGFPEARYGAAQVALRQHRFADGWSDYEARFETAPPMATALALPQPRLTIDALARARRVAVWLEQGLGDQVLYSTLLDELERRGIGAVVEVDARLAGAYRRRFPRMEFTSRGGSANAFDACDFQVPLGSLGGLFRPSVESFSSQPRAFLSPDPERLAEVRRQLGPGRWVGISWRSFQPAERAAVAARKSIPLERFASLARSGARLLDLQYGDVAGDRAAFEALHPGSLTRLEGFDAFHDLETMLAAISACERVVSASNATAHLAGAVGTPTWLPCLGAQQPFHYWVPAPGGRCLWYPAVEIVSDASWTSWEPAFEALAARLAAQ